MSERRNAIVTGSTSGIGLGIARGFAAQGMNIVINGFGAADEIEKIRAGLAEEFSVEVRYSAADMSKPEAITEMVETAAAELGPIDVLVNNAGIQFVSPVEDFPPEKWNAILAINLSAAFYAIKAVVPSMKERKQGRIINLASAHALIASPFKSAYVSAKHGVAGLTKTVALELAEHNITCNAICPGYVLTPLVERQIPDTAKARGMTEEEVVQKVLLEAQPTKRFVTIEEVAALAVFLAGKDAGSITGAIIPIDGGWTAH